MSDEVDDKGDSPRTLLDRRGAMLGAAAGVGAVVAGVLATPSPAGAAQGSAVLLGENNTGATAATVLSNSDDTLIASFNTSPYGYGIAVNGVETTSGGGVGVRGNSDKGSGVYGVSNSGQGVGGFSSGKGDDAIGVGGSSVYGTGVYGQAGEYGSGITPPPSGSGLGVWGDTQSGIAVLGTTSAAAASAVVGVFKGVSGLSGVGGVLGDSSNGNGVVGFTSANGYSGVFGRDGSPHGGNGVAGVSESGIAVSGKSVNLSGLTRAPAGVVGDSNTNAGVVGLSSAQNGVSGVTSAKGFAGVLGNDQSTAGGMGISGQSVNGVGVLAASSKGKALEVQGVAAFSRSGHATVAATKKSVTVTGVALSSSSLLLATLQTNFADTSVQSVVPDVSGSKFTINLSKAIPAGKSASVAWFVVN